MCMLQPLFLRQLSINSPVNPLKKNYPCYHLFTIVQVPSLSFAVLLVDDDSISTSNTPADIYSLLHLKLKQIC